MTLKLLKAIMRVKGYKPYISGYWLQLGEHGKGGVILKFHELPGECKITRKTYNKEVLNELS